jgi:biopolymer transport protein ExbD
MKIRHKTGGLPDKIDINMTPMIDIVFQLLAFFIMSLKIVTMEGDFSIKMPLGAPQEAQSDVIPPIKIRLTANANGDINTISLGERGLTSFDALHQHVIGMVGDPRTGGSSAAEAEVEIDADYNLKYENVIRAVTAVSGVKTDTGHIVKLIEKIKFSPPKKPVGGASP